VLSSSEESSRHPEVNGASLRKFDALRRRCVPTLHHGGYEKLNRRERSPDPG